MKLICIKLTDCSWYFTELLFAMINIAFQQMHVFYVQTPMRTVIPHDYNEKTI